MHKSHKNKVLFIFISLGLSYTVSYKLYLNLYQFLYVFCFVSHRYGDYPMLPNKSQYERDPWYQWDQPDMRHNWGEPVGTPVPLLKLLTSVPVTKF